QPIDIPADARDIRIASDGTISTVVGDIAKLGIVRFDREQFVRPLGGGLHETNEPPLPAENTRIIQGMVEKSNVQPIVEMTTMINVQRAYQANQRLLETNNDLQRNAIQKISQLN
ncbi:MAG: flagellar basal body rod C-terminal domain-containing protein, partial [Pseudomonadota bacterium]|nr:flagellar basal body rod C-terminal domain-containing protein [Pseudomonadota bacterium]